MTQISQAVELLKNGKLVAIPTETVYGLAGSIRHPKAIERLYQVKGRPRDNPLIVHLYSKEQLAQLVEDLPVHFEPLFDAFMPGPLTLVLKKREGLSDQITRGLPTVAVRFPSHPVAREILQRVDIPLVAPSANLSGKPSPTCAAHVIHDFGQTIDGVVDGGTCTEGLESTVLSLVDPLRPVLLRPGSVTKEALEYVLGYSVYLPRKEEPVLSPGMKYRHYSPEAKVFLVNEKPELFDGDCYKEELCGKELYAFLRDCDDRKIKRIFIRRTNALESNSALMNRLSKIV